MNFDNNTRNSYSLERCIIMEIRKGVYRHFKGNKYEVIGMAKNSETLEETVVYRALYGDRGLWVRPASMWNEKVERDGKTYTRFEFIGEKDETV